ncbi:hypothetical protein JHK85_009356 [Glycine max]|nr:hypothetical protein JHK85_009356 [Glycine max]KAG5065371.1 hypothetical protein JHK86_009102 [Glycine max]
MRQLTVEARASSPLERQIEAKLKQPTKSVIYTWQKSGSCPKGTIPIRRILKEDLLRAASLDRFGQKPPSSLQKIN